VLPLPLEVTLDVVDVVGMALVDGEALDVDRANDNALFRMVCGSASGHS
jgi:hypothetical protein